MKQLLLATRNPGKVRDFSRCFSDEDIDVLTLEAFKNIDDVEETGSTYLENATQKAKHWYAQTNLPTLADDSGFEVDWLDGFPGIKSKRWIGSGTYDNDYDRAVGTLEKMKGVPYEKRTARLRCTVVFWDGKSLVSAENSIEGYIPEDVDRDTMELGFPYRSLLFISEFGKLYKDLTEEEHALINHRVKSVGNLYSHIMTVLNQEE